MRGKNAELSSSLPPRVLSRPWSQTGPSASLAKPPLLLSRTASPGGVGPGAFQAPAGLTNQLPDLDNTSEV